MPFLRLMIAAAAFFLGVLAFRNRLAEARAMAGSPVEAVVVLRGAWQRTLPVLLIASVALTAVRGIGVVLALIFAVLSVPLIVAALVRVVVVARDGIVVAGRRHRFDDFAGVFEDAPRGRLVLCGMTPEAPRLELAATGQRRAQLLALLRRKLPEISA